MRLLVVGGGAREHAIIWKIRKSSDKHEIYCTPGNAGIGQISTCIDIEATDISSLLNFAKKNDIDFTIVGMDNPLPLGIVNTFQKEGLKIFGPTKEAAIIESSKGFSKDFMKRNNIPTAKYEVFTEPDKAFSYIEDIEYPAVIKADGLAFGKGVVVCENKLEASKAIEDMMVKGEFKEAGKTIIIEEFLVGEEVSVLSFVDGTTVMPMAEAQDYKKANDNDEGLNTGGMGAFSPCKVYTEDISKYCMDNIFKPTVDAMAREGRMFKGILFFGLILTESGPKVIEYNARFGDPETQVVLPRLENDLLDILLRCENGTLNEVDIKWNNKASVCVVVASEGYPKEYETGHKITGLEELSENKEIFIFHAGTKIRENDILTNGGRVLSVCGVGNNIEQARTRAYDAISQVKFLNKCFRQDIAIKGL